MAFSKRRLDLNDPDYERFMHKKERKIQESEESQFLDAGYIKTTNYDRLILFSDIDFLLSDGWPLIIATDGGSDKFEINRMHSLQSRASASVVILHPPAISFQQYNNASEETQANILNQNLTCKLSTNKNRRSFNR